MIHRRGVHRWLAGLLVLLFALTPAVTTAAWTRPPTTATWLEALNAYRTHAGLPTVTEDAQMSSDCAKHARYMVETNTLAHSEDQAAFPQWYTAEGDLAAKQSNLSAGQSDTPVAPIDSIDGWINSVFHGLSMISTRLASSGYASYFGVSQATGDNQIGACLNVIRGLTGPAPVAPIYWPPKDKTAPFLDYDGGEIPDPVFTCGYTTPTGPFIMLELPQALPQNAPATTGSIKLGGQALESCVYDKNSFQTAPADAAFQNTATSILNSYNAAILVPRQPLQPGNTYTVTLNVNGQDYTWSFDSGTAATFSLTTSVTTAGTGTVNPAGTTAQAQGSVVNVTATPAAGQIFTGWKVNGTAKGWANPLKVTMNGATTVEATFVARPSFQDVPTSATYYTAVTELAARQVIKGCDQVSVPPFFCPIGTEGQTKRAQMAALLVRAMNWSAETPNNPFTDQCDPRGPYDPARNCIDPELWNAVGILAGKGVPLPAGTAGGPLSVAKGYTDAPTCGGAANVPCYAPRDNVLKGQVIIFIARAMIAQGYWTLAADDTTIFPNRNGATDAEKLDHRALVTYVKMTGAPPDVTNATANWTDFTADSLREWFARALWQALNSYFGVNR